MYAGDTHISYKVNEGQGGKREEYWRYLSLAL